MGFPCWQLGLGRPRSEGERQGQTQVYLVEERDTYEGRLLGSLETLSRLGARSMEKFSPRWQEHWGLQEWSDLPKFSSVVCVTRCSVLSDSHDLIDCSRPGFFQLGTNSDGSGGEEHACQYKGCKRRGFSSWVRKIPWRRIPLHYSCLENPIDRNLVGHSPESCKESDTTGVTGTHT